MHTAPYFTAFGLIVATVIWRRLRLQSGPQAEAGLGVFCGLAALALVDLLGLEVVQAPAWYLHLCGFGVLLSQTALALAFEPNRASLRPVGLKLMVISLAVASLGATVWTFVGAEQ
jgi:uncharacterized membrane protein YecN with MAPEG domain